MRSRTLVLAGLAFALVLAPWAEGADKPAAASSPVALPEPLTRDAIRELVARLSDAEVRQLLLQQLDRAAVAPETPRAGLAEEMHSTRTRLRETLAALPELSGLGPFVIAKLTEDRPPGHLGRVGLALALMLAAALAVEWGVRRATAAVRRGLDERRAQGLAAEASQLAMRVVLEALWLAAFAAGAIGVFLVLYQGHLPTRQFVLGLLWAALLVRGVAAGADILLAPGTPRRRLVLFSDATAGRLYRGAVSLAALYAAVRFGLELLSLWGYPLGGRLALQTLAAILFAAGFLLVAWWSRAEVTILIRGVGEDHPIRRLAADLWPALLTAYVLIILAAHTFELFGGHMADGRAGIKSLLLVIVLPLADMALCRVVLAMTGGARDPQPGDQVTAGAASYEPALRRAVHIVVTVGGLLLIARFWGLDLFTLTSQGVGDRVAGALIDVAVALLVAHLVWDLVRTAIDRRLETETGEIGASERGEQGGVGASRARTILPLIRGSLFVALCALTGMVALGALGVNITPLLAGAGVVGLAVGFGAQTLVRDVVSGLFFLLDDAFRLGEYIDVGDVKGTVERIGVRSMQLRHHRGALNTVPYGQVRRLINTSRDWAIVKLEFRLAEETDPLKLKKIVKQVGQELKQDPEIGPSMLEPLKSQGVAAIEDGAILVKVKFMARPGQQFMVQREAF
ncbi:MAG TPA: mechanosensitive ion channel domain-containing protein, partial [Methylomirabilota bacterium]|nr:mechanosensitive ion channel domain-containing protein [Methylomirabilota bacterium]